MEERHDHLWVFTLTMILTAKKKPLNLLVLEQRLSFKFKQFKDSLYGYAEY